MRKLALLSIILIVSLILGACGQKETPTEEVLPTSPPEAVPTEETMPKIDLGGQEINVAVENAYPPFNYIDDETNEPTGWDYDAVAAICGVINCTPVFVEAAWEGIFEATAAGEYDIVADGVTITSERDEIVDFSIPYMVIAQYIMVRTDETEIVDEASLAASDVMVGTQIGTTNEARAIELVGEDRVASFDTFDLPVQALIAGDVGAVVIDEEAGKGFVEQFPDEIELLPDPITGFEELGFVFPPGSDLVEPVNWAIEVLQDNGTFNLLYLRYWGQE
jgi:polar amino acid transport system substrate-binding protein